MQQHHRSSVYVLVDNQLRPKQEGVFFSKQPEMSKKLGCTKTYSIVKSNTIKSIEGD